MIKKLLGLIKWYIWGVKLKYKLFISYVALIVLPLGIFSYATFDVFTNILQNRILFSVQKNYEQTFSYLSVTLKKVSNISDVVLMNPDIQELFSAENQLRKVMDQWELAFKASKFLGTLTSEEITDILVYLPEGSPFLNKGAAFVGMTGLGSWYESLTASTTKLLWCKTRELGDSSAATLSVVRNVKNPNNLKQNIGIIRVDFREDLIQDMLSRAVSVKGSLTYIQNSGGAPMAISDPSLFDTYSLKVSDALIEQSAREGLSMTKINGNTVFYLLKRLEQTDWYLTTVIPYENIFSEIQILQQRIWLLLLLVASTAFIMAWVLTKSLTRRIYLLSDKMKEVQKGRLDSLINTPYRDEIGVLTRNYNYMLRTIEQLMDERYKAGIEIKNAELKLLQAQINPHFLYNMLDMINWLAQKNQVSRVEQAINALAAFYKLGLSAGKDEISVEDEIRHITAYVQLQNMRYQDRIHLVIEVEEEVQKYCILKLMLQPIVENAVLHGIMKKPSRAGTILIKGALEGDTVVLSVQDDGVGMTEEQIKKLMASKLSNRHNGGYGVKNIIERIKLFYGEDYGLTYKSAEGGGTLVEIRIPARENPEHADDSL